MPPRLRLSRAAVLAVFLIGITHPASAQLLPSLLSPVLTTIDTTACALPLLSNSPRLDAVVQKWTAAGARGRLRVIVSAQPGLLGAVRPILSALGATPLGELTGIEALVTDVDQAGLSTLACAAPVSSISFDAPVVVSGTPDAGDSAFSVRATLGLPADLPGGSGIGVAVIDSGIASVADFSNRISSFFDFTSGLRTAVPSDGYGHGTHVAGLIASSGVLSPASAYRGVGPQVRLIGMKVLDSTGAGRTSDVIRAVEYATLRRASLGIQVINLSLGHPIYEPAARDPLVRAVEAASRAGIVVVAAAGNYGMNTASGQIGYAGIASPGNAPSAITVGALDARDTIGRGDDGVAPYSSRGPTWYDGYAKPDVVAPGHRLVSNAAPGSTLSTRYPDSGVGASYLRLSGTSMAAAVASGVVALVLEANHAAHPYAPPLTPNAIKAILEYSAVPVREPGGTEYDALTQGAGGLNASGAIALARSIDTTRPTGYYWWQTPIAPWTVIDGQSNVWSQRLVWGTHIVWGTSVDSNERAWSLNTPWGKNVSWGSQIVWGPDVVWEVSDDVWPSHVVWGTNVVGTSDGDDHIVWGTADGDDHIVWGTTELPDGMEP